MTNPQSPVVSNKYYFYDDATLVVYYSDELPLGHNLIYLGTSDNPDPVSAAGAFTQRSKINSGYRVEPLP